MKKQEQSTDMLDEYDFSKMKARKNPYAKHYFKKEADTTGIPYQTLINLYLIDCAKNKKKLNILWE